MNAQEINLKLLEKIEDVCQYLLPEGKKSGRKWVCGNINGDKGDSFSVCLEGDKAGYFNDFADDGKKGKTLYGLWIQSKGISANAAREEIHEFLGIPYDNDRYAATAKPKYKEPTRENVRGFQQESPVLDYLVNERSIPHEVLKQYKVTETKSGDGYALPYLMDEKLVKLKYVGLERVDGKKKIWSEAEGLSALFGMDAVPEDATEVVITRGEIDAMTWASHLIPAVSVPNGDNDLKWIEICYDWLERFERIYISPENDESGDKSLKQIIDRLGRERCYVITIDKDYKDINDLHCIDGFNAIDLLANAKPIDYDEIKTFDSVWEEIRALFHDESEENIGTPTPWDLPFMVRRKETTLITGYRFQGKSQGMYHLATHLQATGKWRGFMGSFEVPYQQSGFAMSQIASTRYSPFKHQEENIIKLLGNFVFYNKEGKIDWRHFLSVYKYCVKRFGCNFCIIDSFMLCGVPKEDFTAQSEFMQEIVQVGKETNSHMFVVAHPRKDGSRVDPKTGKRFHSPPPNMDDIKGTGDLSDLCFNCLVFWRNMRKTELLQEPPEDMTTTEIQEMHDGMICLEKNKMSKGNHRGKLGKTKTWFHNASGQLLCEKGQSPNNYLYHLENNIDFQHINYNTSW